MKEPINLSFIIMFVLKLFLDLKQYISFMKWWQGNEGCLDNVTLFVKLVFLVEIIFKLFIEHKGAIDVWVISDIVLLVVNCLVNPEAYAVSSVFLEIKDKPNSLFF